MIKRPIKQSPVESLQVGLLPIWKSYLEGKKTEKPFSEKGNRATECLKLTHSDVYEPFKCPN